MTNNPFAPNPHTQPYHQSSLKTPTSDYNARCAIKYSIHECIARGRDVAATEDLVTGLVTVVADGHLATSATCKGIRELAAQLLAGMCKDHPKLKRHVPPKSTPSQRANLARARVLATSALAVKRENDKETPTLPNPFENTEKP